MVKPNLKVSDTSAARAKILTSGL
eukprot:SAG22_NODE_21897_length_253_cov_0.662338_2_plen_23_part_01